MIFTFDERSGSVQVITGGLGGSCREVEGPFEEAVARAVGARVRAEHSDAVALWCALTNIEWMHTEGAGRAAGVAYSFRAAGDLVAALLQHGDYMDWYCCGAPGRVEDWIADAMAAEGWTLARSDGVLPDYLPIS